MNKILAASGTVIALALLANVGTASAATLQTCTVANNTVSVEPALGCASVAGTNDSQAIVRTLVFVDSGNPANTYGPYADLLFLDKDGRSGNTLVNDGTDDAPRAGISENAFYGSITNSGNLLGSFTIDLALLSGWKDFVVFIKPGDDGAYFLIDTSQAIANAINGKWTITFSGWDGQPQRANAISHISLYGRQCAPTENCTPPDRKVPEPGTLGLLGLGLLGLRVSRRQA